MGRKGLGGGSEGIQPPGGVCLRPSRTCAGTLLEEAPTSLPPRKQGAERTPAEA